MIVGLNHIVSARINSAAGAASFRWQTGGFSTITNAVAGTFIGTLLDAYGVDVTEMVPAFAVDGALAASQLTTFGLVSTSDTIKQWTCLREGAAGAASALTDVDHWVSFWKRPIRG